MRKYHKNLTKVSQKVYENPLGIVMSHIIEKTQGNHQVRAFNLLWDIDIADDRNGDHTNRTVKANRVFLFHGHKIVVVNDVDKLFWGSHANWTGSPSTTQAIKGYREYFCEHEGYKDMTYVKD